MPRSQKVITLNSLPGGEYLLAWQEPGIVEPQQHMTSIAVVEHDFPKFCDAVRQCKDVLNTAVPLDDLLIVGAYTYAETFNSCKRFQVYRHMAWVNGWHKRTQLPGALEQAIKATWSDIDEVHVGFLPN